MNPYRDEPKEPEIIGDFEWWETGSGGWLTEVDEGRIVVFDRDDLGWGMGFFHDDEENEKPVWCKRHYNDPDEAAEDATRFYEQEVCPVLGITEAMINFDDVVVKREITIVTRLGANGRPMRILHDVGWNANAEEVYENEMLLADDDYTAPFGAKHPHFSD